MSKPKMSVCCSMMNLCYNDGVVAIRGENRCYNKGGAKAPSEPTRTGQPVRVFTYCIGGNYHKRRTMPALAARPEPGQCASAFLP